MRASELRSLSTDEVELHLEEAREQYFKLRFQYATGGLPDTSKLRSARREIARIATVLGELKSAESEGS